VRRSSVKPGAGIRSSMPRHWACQRGGPRNLAYVKFPEVFVQSPKSPCTAACAVDRVAPSPNLPFRHCHDIRVAPAEHDSLITQEQR